MTVRIRDLREQPLLGRPPVWEESPWLEITPKQVQWMRKGLADLIDKTLPSETDLRDMADLSVCMQTLSLGIPGDVWKHGVAFKRLLQDDANSDLSTGPFICLARNLAKLGFDVTDLVKKHGPSIMSYLDKTVKEHDFWYDIIQEVASIKDIGLDVSEDVKSAKKHRSVLLRTLAHAAKDGHWNDFTAVATSMKAVGLDVKAPVRKHCDSLLGKLAELAESTHPRRLTTYASYAAKLAELGVLTANPQHRAKHVGEAPPLKKFER